MLSFCVCFLVAVVTLADGVGETRKLFMAEEVETGVEMEMMSRWDKKKNLNSFFLLDLKFKWKVSSECLLDFLKIFLEDFQRSLQK